ncbi:hypothetical protein [Nonomuraea dietziae]|uniref:hypothetical protein n=1 Tax=Nonomuraea dietziae TaxID=65515 RepID=UPI00342DB03C
MDVVNLPKPLTILGACVAWLAVWIATQGLFVINDWLPGGSLNNRLAWLTGYMAVVLATATVVCRRRNREFLPSSRLRWLYVLPLALLLLLPFHYDGPVTVPLLAVMIVVTAFWQDCLTFGLVQSFKRRQTSPLTAVLLTGGPIRRRSCRLRRCTVIAARSADRVPGISGGRLPACLAA